MYGRDWSSDVCSSDLATVEGSELAVEIDPAGLTIDGQANVVQPDVVAENGVIHVVDTVLLPPTFDPSTLL